jgi:DNA polymerase-3 subunit delta
MNAYLIWGQDSFRSRQKVAEIINKYRQKSGETDLIRLKGENLQSEDFFSYTSALPFFAQKRLIIVEDLLGQGDKEVQKKIAKVLPILPATTVLVFWEKEDPAPSGPLFKLLNIPGKSANFQKLPPNKLPLWIKKKVAKEGGKIEPEAVEKLVQYVGDDLWRMDNELNKLLAHSPHIIKIIDIETLVEPQIKEKIFDLIDCLAIDKKKTVRVLQKLLALGEDELKIFGMIVYQFRNLLLVKDIQTHKGDFKKLGLHPFVLSKTRAQAQNFTFNELCAIYRQLLDLDLAMKTGKIEPRIALILFLSS